MSEETKEVAAQETPAEECAQSDHLPQTAESAGGKKEKKRDKHEKELAKAREETEKAQKELAETKDLLLRTAAEYDNYRKRTEREKLSSAAFGAANTVEKLLPVLDTLELAAEAKTADEAYKKGVVMTLKQFADALKALGVEEIEGVGAEFDPNLHCAVAREASEELDSGKIVKVMRKGYRMGDRVVRASMVSVAE